MNFIDIKEDKEKDKKYYSFRMKSLPVDKPTVLYKKKLFPREGKEYEHGCMTGEGQYGKWYLCSNMQIDIDGELQYISTFFTEAQAKQFDALEEGEFSIARKPVEKEFTIYDKNTGKETKTMKWVSEYIFSGEEAEFIPEMTEEQADIKILEGLEFSDDELRIGKVVVAGNGNVDDLMVNLADYKEEGKDIPIVTDKRTKRLYSLCKTNLS